MTFRNLRRAAAGSLAAGLLAGCSLDVATPDIVDPDSLSDETSLPTLRAGAIGDFGVAFTGNDALGDEGAILIGGLRADEFLNRDTFEERRDIDLGTARTDNGSLRDFFRNLQRARRSAEFASGRFREAGPTEPGYAEVLNLAGYSTLLLGEIFCPGVPFSDLDANGRLTYGPSLTREATFQRALAKFDSALAVAQAAGTGAAATAQLNVARVGRARALLGLGRVADARAAVAGVPTAFQYNIEYSENTGRQNNAVYTFNNVRRRWGVANNEGTNGLPFFSASDPRVPVTQSANSGLDNASARILNQGKYPARTTPVRLASGVEARLIEAEGALLAGESAAALTILNALRTSANLPALSFAGQSAAQQRALLFRERGFWLFAESQRLGDLRRLLRAPYSLAYNQVFPTGAYFKQGRQYAEQPSLPIPLEEENNPNFAGCTATN
jgi:hypothetical protein